MGSSGGHQSCSMGLRVIDFYPYGIPLYQLDSLEPFFFFKDTDFPGDELPSYQDSFPSGDLTSLHTFLLTIGNKTLSVCPLERASQHKDKMYHQLCELVKSWGICPWEEFSKLRCPRYQIVCCHWTENNRKRPQYSYFFRRHVFFFCIQSQQALH